LETREGRIRISNHWNQGESVYIKDATTISPIIAMPVRAIETSIATIDFAFIVSSSVNGEDYSNGHAKCWRYVKNLQKYP
jgi:hypothetical protein